MKKEKILKKILILVCIIMIVCINSFTIKAASKKEKALQAYDEMLSRSSFNVKSDGMIGNKKIIVKYQTINSSFAIAYIDKNSIPELIVQNFSDTSHVAGYGAIFTYKNGKVKQIAALSLNEFLKYYKKKGVIIDTYSGMGFSEQSYKKISNGKIKAFASTSKNFGNPGSKKRVYYDAGYHRISKNNFNKLIKKYVKSTKPAKVEFIQNTIENRRQYLK